MKKYLTLLLASLLFGCGGGGGGDTTENITENITEKVCSNDSTTIFTDCLSTTWAISMRDDNSDTILYGLNGKTENASWAVVDLDDGVHGKVIDIQMSQTTGFSDFAFRSVVDSTDDLNTIDLTDYENGNFIFDLKVLDYGQSELGIFTHFQCGWPCHSPFVQLTTKYSEPATEFTMVPEVDQWVTIRVPLSDLTVANRIDTDPDLNLSLVDAILLAPPYASETEQKGVHYQLDNIRFEYAE